MNAQLPAGGSPIAGRYTLGRALGAGAAAVVHAGLDLRTNARVAVKLYRPNGVAVRLQQQRELEALARLDHPGLVTLHDGGTEPGPTGAPTSSRTWSRGPRWPRAWRAARCGSARSGRWPPRWRGRSRTSTRAVSSTAM